MYEFWLWSLILLLWGAHCTNCTIFDELHLHGLMDCLNIMGTVVKGLAELCGFVCFVSLDGSYNLLCF